MYKKLGLAILLAAVLSLGIDNIMERKLNNSWQEIVKSKNEHIIELQQDRRQGDELHRCPKCGILLRQQSQGGDIVFLIRQFDSGSCDVNYFTEKSRYLGTYNMPLEDILEDAIENIKKERTLLTKHEKPTGG